MSISVSLNSGSIHSYTFLVFTFIVFFFFFNLTEKKYEDSILCVKIVKNAFSKNVRIAFSITPCGLLPNSTPRLCFHWYPF